MENKESYELQNNDISYSVYTDLINKFYNEKIKDLIFSPQAKTDRVRGAVYLLFSVIVRYRGEEETEKLTTFKRMILYYEKITKSNIKRMKEHSPKRVNELHEWALKYGLTEKEYKTIIKKVKNLNGKELINAYKIGLNMVNNGEYAKTFKVDSILFYQYALIFFLNDYYNRDLKNIKEIKEIYKELNESDIKKINTFIKKNINNFIHDIRNENKKIKELYLKEMKKLNNDGLY